MQTVIDVDAAVENTMVMFSAIEELRKDTEEGWKKLAEPLEQVITANNATNVGAQEVGCSIVSSGGYHGWQSVRQPGQD